MEYPFHKMDGCGNDFIFIDNRVVCVQVSIMADQARKICAAKTGLGADGLVFIDPAPDGSGSSYRWHFYNADGSRGEMCGNASRCVSWLAVDLKLASTDHRFLTDVGQIQAQVDYDRRWVKVRLTDPVDQRMDITLPTSQGQFVVHHVDTGVPHVVLILPGSSGIDVDGLGREIRWHSAFTPKGANVDFVSVLSRENIFVRTYERGVEAETKACGTGAAAAQLICNSLGLTQAQVNVTTSGGEIMEVDLREGQVFLAGVVNRVCQGTIDPVFWRQRLE